MNVSTRRTRIIPTTVALGAGAVTCLALAFSSPAVAEGGDGRADVGYAKHGSIEPSEPVDVGAAKHGSTEPSAPVGRPRPADIGRLLNEIDTPTGPGEEAPTPENNEPAPLMVDDGSFEVLQVALGAAGGATLVGIGIVAFRGRFRPHALGGASAAR